MSGLVSPGSEGSVPVAHVHGEIDLANARRMRDGVLELVAEEAPGLIVDLADVPYMDSAGIQALFDLVRHLRERDQVLALAVPTGSHLRRVLKITSFHEAAPICDTTGDAANHLLDPNP